MTQDLIDRIIADKNTIILWSKLHLSLAQV